MQPIAITQGDPAGIGPEIIVRACGRGELHDAVVLGDPAVLGRAARALQAASGTRMGADISVHKNLPWGAGLGGGSSNAASTLLALNRLWNLNWPRQALLGLALPLGADVPFLRPAELADDFTPTVPVIAHAIRACAELGWPARLACCIYPAVPLLQPQTLADALALLEAGDAPYAFPVLAYRAPIQRALRRDLNGRSAPLHPEYMQTRTQDLPAAFHDADGTIAGLVGVITDLSERIEREEREAREKAERERLAAEAAALSRLRLAARSMLDALKQWKHAEDRADVDELACARKSRDAAITEATGEPA